MKSFLLFFFFIGYVYSFSVSDLFSTSQLDNTVSTANTWAPANGYRSLFTRYTSSEAKIESNQLSVELHNTSSYCILQYNYVGDQPFNEITQISLYYASQAYYMTICFNLFNSTDNGYGYCFSPGAVTYTSIPMSVFASHFNIATVVGMELYFTSEDDIHRGGLVISKIQSS
jgi:hypothetical protein